MLAHLLATRGVTTFEEARAFFRPSLDDLHDPFLMHDMEKAVERVLRALATKEKVLVYGDYDVDGTNGTALLWTFLRSAGANVEYYIPDRVKEGYGISSAGIVYASQRGVTLIVAVDCGITALNQVEEARALGIDAVICDHHEPGEAIPNAYAVLNPHKHNCSYPFKELCGAGVAFKLVQALLTRDEILRELSGDPREILRSYLDYVALATAADIVPVQGENRILLKFGLEVLNTNPRPGIRALAEIAGLKIGTINTSKIVFILAPRINAVGRVGDAMRAVRLLTSAVYEEALRMAWVCEEENKTRRKLDEDTLTQAKEIIEKYFEADDEPAIILHNDGWHPGVLGIVASRLTERYHRPAIILTTIEGIAKGSARSIAGFDVYAVLKECERHLLQYGGHKYAAGLTVELSKINEFREAFLSVARKQMTDEMRTPSISIDAEVGLKELTPKFVRVLHQFEPFGPQNPRPIFMVRSAEIAYRPRIVGNNHLSVKFKENGQIFDAIGYNLGDFHKLLGTDKKRVDMVFAVDKYENGGETYPQLRIRDIRVSGAEVTAKAAG